MAYRTRSPLSRALDDLNEGVRALFGTRSTPEIVEALLEERLETQQPCDTPRKRARTARRAAGSRIAGARRPRRLRKNHLSLVK